MKNKSTIIQLLDQIQKPWVYGILIPINLYALLLADPLYENITHIAYALQHLPFVFCWAFSCALYFWCYTLLFMKRIGYQKKGGLFLLSLSCSGMLISICIPYGTDTLLSQLHIHLAMASTILYILYFTALLFHYHFYDPKGFSVIFPRYLCMISSLSLLFIIMGCVSTLMESLFVIFMGLLHLTIKKQLQS